MTIYDVGTDAQKEASWLYLKYLTSTENTAYFAAQTGYIPVRKSAAEDPVFKEVLKEKPIKQLCFIVWTEDSRELVTLEGEMH